MRHLNHYIVETLSDNYEKQLLDMITSGEINNDNIEKILKKIRTLNAKNKYSKDNDIYLEDYIAFKLYTFKSYNTKNKENRYEGLINPIYHHLCKYLHENNKLDEFVKPFDDFYKSIRKKNEKYFKVSDNIEELIKYVYKNHDDENILIHVLNLDNDSFSPDLYTEPIRVRNVYDEMGKSWPRELLETLAKIAPDKIGKFEILYKIFYYNVINPARGDLGVVRKNGDVSSVSTIEFKAGKFALKSNGVDNVEAYNEFFNFEDKAGIWQKFIDKVKNNNIKSPLETKGQFEKTNKLFLEFMGSYDGKDDDFYNLYKEAFNNVFNARITSPNKDNDFFDIAEINIENLIHNDFEETKKFNYVMASCDFYNLVSTPEHNLIMIFDDVKSGNYVFVNFSGLKNVKDIYNFITNTSAGYEFDIKDGAWWRISGQEQGLVSMAKLEIK